MSIYITGDTHGELDIYKLMKLSKSSISFTKEDVLIICGDFGFIWSNEQDEYELSWLERLNDFPWTTCFVDGNHENFDRLEKMEVVRKFDGNVHQLHDSVFHLMRGEIYTIEGLSFFCFGGAFSTDREYRREGVSWWAHELPSQLECMNGLTNLEIYNKKVDIVISHDAPKSVANELGYDRDRMDGGYPMDRMNICEYLDSIYNKIEFNHWFCGHYHINKHYNESFHFLYDYVLDLYNLKVVANGNPKYLYKDTVSFHTMIGTLTGTIVQVIRQGIYGITDGEPGYEILTYDVPDCPDGYLCKYVRESDILSRVEE